MTSVKKQPQFWAQHIKPTMTFDTFKTRLRDYLRRTNQVLPATQLERMRLPDAVIKRYALLYLDVCATVINKAQFFEEYIIVPPYNEVPSYEHFLRKVNPMITKLVEENRSICSEQQVCMIFSSIVDLHDPGNHIAFFKQQEESELDNNCSEQPVMMEETYTDSEATSELDNLEQLSIMDDTVSETTIDNSFLINQCTTLQIDLEASRVKVVYKSVRKLTGTLGSDGSGGPINGELRVGCMQKVIAFLVAFCSLTSSSRFIDIGSGQGKPSFHVAQSPGVRLSIGVEVERLRWMVI
jgi:hypothetical protein